MTNAFAHPPSDPDRGRSLREVRSGLERIGGRHGSIFPRSDGRFAANACGGTVMTRLATVAGAEVVHRDVNTLTATFPAEALPEVARILQVWKRLDGDAT